jgi:hypothetical protein
MNRKLLKQLVIHSYQNGSLHNEKVMMIADRLTRKELKQYIKALKYSEKLRTVIVDLPTETTSAQTEAFESLFPDKKVLFRKDPSLMLGMRIHNNDDVFEMNLKHNLDAIITRIEQDYD